MIINNSDKLLLKNLNKININNIYKIHILLIYIMIISSTIDYSNMIIKKLILLCKKNHIKGYSNKKKTELVHMLSSKNNIAVFTPTIKMKNNINDKLKVDMPIIYLMDNDERVKKLKEHLALSKVNHESVVMKLLSLKEAHTYCVIHRLSAQQYGPLLEKYIRTKFNYIKNKAENCIGDCSKNGKNSEVKVSLCGLTHTKFNFVQIRPSHDCDTYIMTAYNLSFENVELEGELYIFNIPKEDIKNIIISFGRYAHGTIKEHGKITIESLNNKKSTKEYALRPTINDACWKALLPFKVTECEL